MRAAIHFIIHDERDKEIPVTIYTNEQNNEITLEVESRGQTAKVELPYRAWREIVYVIQKMGLDRWE